jgi:hypothetical protein
MFDPMLSQQAADILAGLNFGANSSNTMGGDMSSGNVGGNGMSNNPQGSGNGSGQQNSAMDITSRLESLCLSMTEGVLGPTFSNF